MIPTLENNTPVEIPNKKDIERYKKLRAAGKAVNKILVKQLPKSAIQECGKKLGILKNKILLLSHESEIDVLVDYCFFHFRINKINVISRFLLMTPPEKDSIEMEALDAMQKACYTLLIVKEAFENKGVLVFDIIKRKDFFLIDLSLSLSAEAGMMFAGHIIPIGQFYITSGALLPIPHSLFENEIIPIVRKCFSKNDVLSPAQEALFAAQVIRSALKAGVLEDVEYQ